MPTVRFCQSWWTNLSAAGQICRDSCCSAERGEAAERRPRRRDRRRCRGAGRPSGAFFPPRFARRFFLSSLLLASLRSAFFSLVTLVALVASSRLASLGGFYLLLSSRPSCLVLFCVFFPIGLITPIGLIGLIGILGIDTVTMSFALTPFKWRNSASLSTSFSNC